MQMLTTSSVHLRPAPPKITKTPFSLVTPKSLSTHALGKNISVRETVQLETQKEEKRKHGDLVLHSIAPYSLVLASKLLPGADVVESIFGPFVDLVKTWSLPEWLVHWGHPGNMVTELSTIELDDPKLSFLTWHESQSTNNTAPSVIPSKDQLRAVVLLAMGGYGTYLGFRIRLSKDPEEKAKAKDLHPKLLAGMFFFFALGATGGITALLTSDKPIFESPHAVSGAIGLGLLTIQSILPALFEDYPGLRVAHGLLGSSIMTIFLIHAAFGLQLGLNF